MEITLDKSDLIHLVNGIEPNFSVFMNPMIIACGSYNGAKREWKWINDELVKLSENQLYDLYLLCKNEND